VAEKRKFAALANLDQHLDEPETAEAGPEPAPAPVRAAPAAIAAPPATIDPGRGRGRPPTGKRSNPDWKLYSHFLKKKTQRAAVARLQAGDEGRDLSDVLEELLEGWLRR
jgi:hypothetical protein